MNPAALKRFLASGPCQLVCRLFLGGVFLYAGAIKVLDPAGMAAAIAGYDLLPEFLVYPLAVFLPWFELLTGGLLMSGVFSRSGALLLSTLLLLFMLAISINVFRGHDHACGCFSASTAAANGLWLLVRDAFFLLPGLVIVFFGRRG